MNTTRREFIALASCALAASALPTEPKQITVRLTPTGEYSDYPDCYSGTGSTLDEALASLRRHIEDCIGCELDECGEYAFEEGSDALRNGEKAFTYFDFSTPEDGFTMEVEA